MSNLYGPITDDERKIFAEKDLYSPIAKHELESGPAEEISPLASGLRHFVQDGSVGMSDEIAGGIEAAGRVVGVDGAGGPMKDIGIDDDGPTLDWNTLRDAYKRARDKERNTLKKDKIANPNASAIGGITGSIMSPANKIAPNASFAKQGAIFGGASGFGSSEAENVSELVADTALGAGLGLGFGKAADESMPYIQKGFQNAKQAVGEKFKDAAEHLSARVLGAERGTIKKLGADKVKDAGRYALDNELFGAFSNTDDVMAKNAAVKAKGGAMMDDVYSQIDDAGQSTFNPQKAGEKVNEELGQFWRSPINKEMEKQLDNTIESILVRGEGNIPIKEAQLLKEELGKVANWNNKLNITDKNQMARDAYGIISKQIDDAVESGAQAIGSEGLLSTLKQGKKLFSNAKGAEALLENKLAREHGNKMLGLTDWSLLGGGGAATVVTGGAAALPTAAALGAKKYAEKYGSQQGALAFDKVSKYLLKSPEMQKLAAENPKVFQAIVYQFEKKLSHDQALPKDRENQDQPPEADNSQSKPGAQIDKENILKRVQGSKFGKVLENAASRGDDAFGAAHFVLSQRDPEYRKQIESSSMA